VGRLFDGFFLQKNKGCVTLHGLAIYINTYLNAKEEFWKFWKFWLFTMQKYNLKEYQNPSRYHKLYNHLSQVSTQAKISFFKNPLIKIDLLLLLLLPRGQNPP
jgi:hypothetical protein